MIRILQGDCCDVLGTLADKSVNCVVTSPPYLGLRDYGVPPSDWPAIEFLAVPGLPRVSVPAMSCCLGLETDPWAFIGHLVHVFRQIHRVLRDDGTLWLNMGDSYAGNAGGYSETGSRGKTSMPGLGIGTMAAVLKGRQRRPPSGIKEKDLMGIPWMLAFALRCDGWYLRQDIIWNKPNPMPESVRDRCTKAHEYMFLLSKSPQYYYDRASIAEARVQDEDANGFRGGAYIGGAIENELMGKRAVVGNKRVGTGVGFGHGYDQNPKPRVTSSNRNSFARETKYSAGEHGQKAQHRPDREDIRYDEQRNKRSVWTIATHPFKEAHYATFPPDLVEPCILAGCPAGGVVLDPFGGSGTTGLVADRLQRDAILIELKPENVAMAKRRVTDDAPLFAKVE